MMREAACAARLVVFDLDLTLWTFRLDKHMKSPFQFNERGKVIDSCNREPELMKDTLLILDFLKGKGYEMAVVSRIKDICGAYQLMNFLGLSPYFAYREIYPGCKKRHFRSLREKSKTVFPNMTFFDDDWRNIRDVSSLGVKAVHTPEGISKRAVLEALGIEHY